MKKTLLITFEFPPFFGGVGYYYYNIVKRLPLDKIIVLTEKKERINPESNFKIYYKKLLTNIPIWPKWLFSIPKAIYIIKKEKIQLLWAGQVLPIGTVCLIIKKLLNIPYFVSLHGTDILTAQKSNRKKKLLLKILIHAKFITANSQFTKNEILKFDIPEEKIIIIYPCANKLNTLSQTGLNDFKLKYDLTDYNILLSVCRLTPRKSLDSIVKAIPEVLKVIPNLKYFIIGNGQEYNNLNQLINNLNLGNNIKILRNINNDELPGFYALANIFILTPKDANGEVEGLGMVFLEASLLAKPIITSANGGIPEVILENKTGLIVEPENHHQISQAVIKLLNDKNLSKNLGENAKKFVLKKFQWSQEVNKLLNILKA